MSKERISATVDKEILDKAREKGINVSAVIEKAIGEVVKLKKCPVCGGKIK